MNPPPPTRGTSVPPAPDGGVDAAAKRAAFPPIDTHRHRSTLVNVYSVAKEQIAQFAGLRVVSQATHPSTPAD